MPANRPAIPRETQRAVLVEAGHRCAIPTCRTVPVEVAHIAPYRDVKSHEFANLIALCPTCHTRYDHGDIDRAAMRQYKANLAVLSSRYGEIERRVLDNFAADPDAIGIRLPGGWDIALLYLLKDGLIEKVKTANPYLMLDGMPVHVEYRLTDVGFELVARWRDAQPVSPEADP